MSVSQSKEEATAIAIGKIQTVINLIHESIKKIVPENEQNQYILQKSNNKQKNNFIISFDFSYSLRYLCDNWDNNGYANSLKSEKLEFEKISKRCIEIRNKASHQGITLEECERELEHLRRLASLINSEVESSVDRFLGLNTSGKTWDWESFKETGNKYVKDGRYTEAMVEYSRAISINHKEPVLYSNRAIVELKLRKFEEAREDAEDAIQFSANASSKDRVKYYRLLSEALIGLKLFEEADSVCLKGLELEPRDEVLAIRKREINSMILTRETNKNPREDIQTSMNRIKSDDDFIFRFLDDIEQLKLSTENVLEIKNPLESNNRIKISQRVGEAHEWFHGLNGKKVDYKKAFDIFKEAADQGFAEGLYNVGKFFKNGYGAVEVDYYQMMEYYKKAASQKPFVSFNGLQLPNKGVLESEYAIGLAFKNGTGVDIDYSRAFQHFLKPAQLGFAAAQNNLGWALREGQGVAQDLKYARYWMQKAAEQGLSEAQFNYAGMLERGEGGHIDEKTALEYYDKAAKQGVPDALSCLERLSKAIGDENAQNISKNTFTSLQEKGDPNAFFLLGLGHLYGQSGLPRDLNLAYKYLKNSAEKYHLSSIKLLINLLLDDLKRNEEAFSYCVEACKMGDDESLNILAKLYAYGHGCEMNEEKARRLAQRYNLVKNEETKLDIEKEIELGKKLIEFEKSENLKTDNMTIEERMIRFVETRGKIKEYNPFENLKKIINNKVLLQPCDENGPKKIKWLPEIVALAEKGSITAKRMLLGWTQSWEALELISRNENETAMKVLRQSYVNCDQMQFFFPEKIWSALQKCNPDNPDAMFIRCQFFGNDLFGGLNFTKRCIRIHPTDAGFYHHLGCLYGFLNSFQDGVRAINRAIELDSSNPRWYYYKGSLMTLGMEYDMFDNTEEAIEVFKKYLELNPVDDRKVPQANYFISSLYMMKKDYEQCKVYAFRAIESEKLQLPCFLDDINDFPAKITVKKFLKLFSHLCGYCGKQNPRFKCACLEEAYCDKNCQVCHWKYHKLICKIKNKRK